MIRSRRAENSARFPRFKRSSVRGHNIFNSKFIIQNSKLNSMGFTLIELIIFIVIAGIFVPLTFIAFSSALKESMTPENVTTNRLTAEQVIELTAKQIPTLTTDFTAYPITPATCSGISGCTVTAIYQTFNGSAFANSGSATNYVLVTVTVNSFTTNTLVTKHAYP
ncbi:MAG: hypothetical protein C0392_09535 [Syntrophus sp. (in: bacteria)]|nr:hypothetical protein [Syntrophus sp. (in: bacteria)]